MDNVTSDEKSKEIDIFFISAGMKAPKKDDGLIFRKNLYPNYGLIGLASIMESKGYNARVFHGDFYDVDSFIDILISNGLLNNSYPIFLSIPSSFALTWTQEFCTKLKLCSIDCKIVIGGKWVVGNDGAWVTERIPEVDLVIYGNAERRVEDLVSFNRWGKIPGSNITAHSFAEPFLNTYPGLNYGLVYNYQKYQPSVEVSRGCGLGCSFCVEKDSPLSNMQSPKSICDSLISHYLTYNNEEITPYFQASFFRPTSSWAAQFLNEYRESGLTTKWRSETRVDSLSISTLASLAKAGLKVIDLGLESASTKQLLAMNKSTKPDIYLKKASALLRECKNCDIWVKVNILLYAGEDEDTISETCAWLDEFSDCIKGISVNPLFIYRFGSETKSYMHSLSNLGAYAVDESSLDRLGYAEMHLSASVDNNAAIEIASQIRKQFMSARDYYDLKSFSYFPRGYSYQDFNLEIRKLSELTLPFSI